MTNASNDLKEFVHVDNRRAVQVAQFFGQRGLAGAAGAVQHGQRGLALRDSVFDGGKQRQQNGKVAGNHPIGGAVCRPVAG